MEYTERGFADFGDFKDTKGSTITVRESSAVGEPCVWIFAEADPRMNWDNPSPHLNVGQAKKLIRRLAEFVDFAERPDNWRNDPEYKEKFWDIKTVLEKIIEEEEE